ncbi:hypothetical protein WJ0W_001551 [Paenibacillus melissococcoides]|uniref:Uncharacterized protein n=1 Tax=Paenibacillus melissococcoides TaxID=2912268 RepID=A0ABN8U073_9BACL|nr:MULTISPECIES: hypothetical protein [Paenibacillus]MEB9896560.1 hypothetical protein [Bacillus cereus]CAH8244313.1 hypothetical protein WJ0W_001551 [Paenibacillus melissococcoides]CAH8703455.1 hypothetical protein HTL2_000118 [Paenibacillus melissococcoides]CAH8705870.1 hypothetical protein WDD9_001078 [Paenibacillus melissococcoides]
MVETANPAFVQEFTLFQPLPDEIPAKVHPLRGFLLSTHCRGRNSCRFAGMPVTKSTSEWKTVISQFFGKSSG